MIYNAKKDPVYRAPVEQFLRHWFDGGSIPRTPKGLAWRDNEGSIRHAGKSYKRSCIEYSKNGYNLRCRLRHYDVRFWSELNTMHRGAYTCQSVYDALGTHGCV